MIFKTRRLVLRPWKEKDARHLYLEAKNPKIGGMAGWLPHKSKDESLHIIKTVFSKPETYAIVFREKPIGCINLLLYPDGNYYWGEGNAELGYWIGEKYWGREITVEAAKELLSHAFKDLNIKTVFATFQENNKQSKRVLEKLGFKYYDKVEKLDINYTPYFEIAMFLNRDDYL